MAEQRRSDDNRVAQLVTDVDELKKQMTENTAVTVQVRDILASFRGVAAVAKWITVIAGMVAALIAAFKGVDFRR